VSETEFKRMGDDGNSSFTSNIIRIDSDVTGITSNHQSYQT